MDGVKIYFYQPIYSSILTCLYLCLPDKKVYTAGITNKVRIKENKIPPTTTMPNGIRLVAAAPRLNAIGKAPKEVAKLVINIGRSRCEAASLTASNLLMPCSRF